MKNSMMILVLLLSFLSCENKNDKLHLTIMNQSTTEIENMKLYTYYGGQGEWEIVRLFYMPKSELVKKL